jgi:fido (protein-threonine AMPylation protein)
VNCVFERIEGATPIDDVSELIPQNVGYLHQLNPLEAANIALAVEAHLRDGSIRHEDGQFDLTWMLAVHRDMFGRVWRWAGRLRRSQTTIGIPPGQVEQQLFQLCGSIPFLPNPPGFADIAFLHHRLVQIHPFPNGNGRWSRLVANVLQFRTTGRVTNWPDDLVGTTQLTSPIRGEYIAALREADAGRYAPLAAMHERYTVDVSG